MNKLILNSPAKLIAQAYNGANVMGGAAGGVQTKMKEWYKRTHYAHCYVHQLNFIMQKTASINAKVFFF